MREDGTGGRQYRQAICVCVCTLHGMAAESTLPLSVVA